jgi:hypothetical protein
MRKIGRITGFLHQIVICSLITLEIIETIGRNIGSIYLIICFQVTLEFLKKMEINNNLANVVSSDRNLSWL